MINSTANYKAAIIGNVRRMYVQATVNIVDPDITFGAPSGSPQSAYSQGGQLHDYDFDAADKYATLSLTDGSLTALMSLRRRYYKPSRLRYRCNIWRRWRFRGAADYNTKFRQCGHFTSNNTPIFNHARRWSSLLILRSRCYKVQFRRNRGAMLITKRRG